MTLCQLNTVPSDVTVTDVGVGGEQNVRRLTAEAVLVDVEFWAPNCELCCVVDGRERKEKRRAKRRQAAEPNKGKKEYVLNKEAKREGEEYSACTISCNNLSKPTDD